MNNHEFKQVEKEFEEMIYRGIMPLFEFEINHSDCDCILFRIALYNDVVFLGFDTDIVNTIYPSGNAIVCASGVEYNIKELDGDTLDQLLEFLHEESSQFLLDSNLL